MCFKNSRASLTLWFNIKKYREHIPSGFTSIDIEYEIPYLSSVLNNN